MERLLLDSAPAVDLRRSARLPTEVLESIHAFVPRDSLAKSPIAKLFLDTRGHFREAFRLRALCLLCHKRTKTRTFRPGYGEFDRRIYAEHHCYLCTSALHHGWRPSPQWQRGIERKSFRRWFRHEIEILTEFGGAAVDWEEVMLNSSLWFEMRAREVRWRRFH